MKFKEGFVDLHTHTRYPCTKYFNPKDIEDAAHNGGYNTLLAMPNSEVVIDDINNLKKAQLIDKDLSINILRTAALTKNLDGKELVDYQEFIKNNVFIFTDDGYSLVDDNLADEAFKMIGKFGGAVFQHCEKNCHTNPGDIASNSLDENLTPIHCSEETEILIRDINLVEKYGTRYHLQHISCSESVEILKEALNQNLPVTAEVTPHHLLKNNNDMDISNGNFKMYPPLRSEDDRQALIEGLKSQIIQVIATDHAPHPDYSKKTSFKLASRGVVGLESAFPMLYSSKIFSIKELESFLITNPKKILEDIGYIINNESKNYWKKCNKVFHTKSKFNNSVFEKNMTLVEKEIINV